MHTAACTEIRDLKSIATAVTASAYGNHAYSLLATSSHPQFAHELPTTQSQPSAGPHNSQRNLSLQTGKVVYFRARQQGACTYFNDTREGPLPHGLCWASYCSHLQVVDVPGDHFSLLRQDEQDMSVIVDTMQLVLSDFGWHVTIKQDKKKYSMNEVRHWLPGCSHPQRLPCCALQSSFFGFLSVDGVVCIALLARVYTDQLTADCLWSPSCRCCRWCVQDVSAEFVLVLKCIQALPMLLPL